MYLTLVGRFGVAEKAISSQTIGYIYEQKNMRHSHS